MTTLREAAQQALEALGLWATGRDMDAVELNDLIFRLEAALAEPTQSQQLAAAGFTPRDRRLECDECGGRFTRQMLPIHKCAALAEPDLDRCPRCGGPADNGHDREVPPNPYYCTKCMAEPVQEPVAWNYRR